MVTVAGYGRWASGLSAAEVARGKVSLSDLCSDGEALYWLESRPAEAGRVVFVRTGADGPRDHSPPGVSIRSRVHEYGGGAVCLVPGWGPGAFAFVDQSDQRVWFRDGGAGAATPLTAAPAPGTAHRHGGLSATPDGRWVLAVRETHGEDMPAPVRSIVALSTRRQERIETMLLRGHDFFGSPRVAPTGERLAVVVWDHPDMPWDASSVVVCALAENNDGVLLAPGAPVHVAGGPGESVGQPAWQRDGSLRFVADRRGWWQPYRRQDVNVEGAASVATPTLEPLTEAEGEFHGPDWVLGQCTMAELAEGTLVARLTTSGRDTVVALAPGAPATAPPRELGQPCVSIAALCAHGDGYAMIGSTPDAAVNVWVALPGEPARSLRPLATTARRLRSKDLSDGEPFALTGRSGRAVYGTLYRPALTGTTAPAGRPPPLVTWCHSGPTSSCQAGLDPTLQFFTSRGFAVACVDYAGSSGYGRAYRCALWGQWGVADAEDCLDAALHLAAHGDVDPQRLAVRGNERGRHDRAQRVGGGGGVRGLHGVLRRDRPAGSRRDDA